MAQENKDAATGGFTTPRPSSKGNATDHQRTAAYQDLETERYERRLKTQRLRELRIAEEKKQA